MDRGPCFDVDVVNVALPTTSDERIATRFASAANRDPAPGLLH